MRVDAIDERLGSDGRTTYRVRVRRRGEILSATFDDLDEALGWRDRTRDAFAGRADFPAIPRRRREHVSPAAPLRVVTVEDASRRLCRAMRDGTARARSGGRYKPSVVRTYEEALRLDVVPRVGSVPVVALGRGDVQLLVDELAAERSARAAQKALTALRVALRLCERYGEIAATPCVGIRVPAEGHEERPARILTPEEVTALVRAGEADDADYRRSFAAPLVALLAGTGLRLGEALALPWGPDGLDVDAGTVRVRRSLDRARGADGELALVPAKTRSSRRDVPLTPEEAGRLRRHRLATGRPVDGSLVFADRAGRPVGPGLPRAAWARLLTASGIAEPLPRLHDLRHAAASHMLASGLTAHAVAELLGHADAGLVWRRYGHALPDEVARAGETLSTWLRRRAESAG